MLSKGLLLLQALQSNGNSSLFFFCCLAGIDLVVFLCRLKNNLGLIASAREVGDLAATVDDTGGVYFVTGFSGLFAP
jgi:hypothetical protein